MIHRTSAWAIGITATLLVCSISASVQQRSPIGRELAIPRHLQNDEEFKLPLIDLVAFGRRLFTANWTDQDGGGRPMAKGTGAPLSDPAQPLIGLRSFNRVSGPDANSCQGCHRSPYNIPGGSGDAVTQVFEQAQRFDFATFDRADTKPTRGSRDERNAPVSLENIGDLRVTPGLFGAGYLEMLSRQMTEDLRRVRDTIEPGQTKALVSKGISFGTLTLRADGYWDTRAVQGLSPQSLLTSTQSGKPSLLVRPWQQSGISVSLRDLTNTSFNQHHGIQTTERFGVGTDTDGDGVVNEMTRADVTAVAVFEATLPVPGRLIPNDAEVERAVLLGEQLFDRIRCATCHVPSLPLNRRGWIYSEPNPYNPPLNLRRGEAPILELDLTKPSLPEPRLVPSHDDPTVVRVDAYTDFKLHDITNPADSSAKEPLDMNQSAPSAKFILGNRRFLTHRLWGVGNQSPYFHDGRFTTMREAVLAHDGEALQERQAFERLTDYERNALIEFLKSLQVLPPGTKSLVVDEHFQPKVWPPTGQYK